MDAPVSVRLDKWLWAVRLFKTRTQAAAACTAGKVTINGQPTKASRDVRVGDVIVAQLGELTKTVKVIGVIEKRVGAKLVSQFLEDLTPASEYEKPREKNLTPFIFRPKGAGRPTKRDRRKMDDLLS